MSIKTFLISLLEGEKMSEPLVDTQNAQVDPFAAKQVATQAAVTAAVTDSAAAAEAASVSTEESPLEKLKSKVSAIESAIELFGKEAEAELAALAEKYL